MNRFDGKVVMVTGAASGIGLASATEFAKEGGTVVATDVNAAALEAAAAGLKAEGLSVEAAVLDVTDRAAWDDCVDGIVGRHGRLDVLFNNAGIGEGVPFLKMTEGNWRSMLDTNLDGAWRVAHRAAVAMAKNGKGGNIVNIASILGLRVGQGLSHYAVAKAGVVQLTKAMALELARDNIRVNALAPGYFRTEMKNDYFESEKGQEYIKQKVPMRRLGQLEELSGPLLLLASEAGSFITGTVINVDGGHLNNSL